MEDLFVGFTSLNYKTLIMFVIGFVLIYLAIKKNYEPTLLLPIGFGTILVNMPLSAVKYVSKVVDPIVTNFIKEHPDSVEFFEKNLNYVYDSATGQAYRVEPGVLEILLNGGILTELFPVLIFVAIGAMIDFTPLFKNPVMVFFGTAAQFGRASCRERV